MSLQRSPRLSSWFKGAYSEGREGKGTGKDVEKEEKVEKRQGTGGMEGKG